MKIMERKAHAILLAAVVASLLVVTVSLPQKAQAKSYESPRFSLAARFGFGGDLEYETEADNEFDSTAMNPSFGAFVQLEFPVLNFLFVGGRVDYLGYVTSEEADENLGRHSAISLDPLVKFRLQLPDGQTTIYAAFPIGPSLTIPSKDLTEQFETLDIELSPGIAWNFSALAGIHFQGGGNKPGLFIEGGWMLQNLKYPATITTTNAMTNESTEEDDALEGKFSQIALNAGFSFPF